MRKLKQLFALLMVMVCLLSSLAVTASAVTSSNFKSGDYCEVSISSKLIDKSGRQYATVRLKTKQSFGIASNPKVDIVMTDKNGRTIWSGTKDISIWGTTLKLGDDNLTYRIYVTPHRYSGSGFWGNVVANANDFNNTGKCVTWQFDNAKNCTIS